MKKLFAFLAIGAAIFTTVPAHAAPTASATVSQFAPGWLTPSTDVQLTVEYTSDAFHSSVSIESSVSKTPLVGRSLLPDIMNNKSLPALKVLTTDVTTDVEAGTRDINVFIPRTHFTNLRTGVYIIHLEINDGEQTISLNIPTPYVSGRIKSPLNVVTVWTVGDEPNLNVKGNPRDESAFDEGSSLDALVQAGTNAVTWVVYKDATVTASALGKNDWLNAIEERKNNGYATPYASSDITTLARAGLKNEVDFALNQSNPVLFAPRQGDTTTSIWRQVTSNAGVVVLSDKCYPSTSSTFTPNGIYRSGGRTALISDSQLGAFMTKGISQSVSAVAHQQAWISDLLMTQQELPNASRLSVVVPSTMQTDISRDNANRALNLLNAPWVNSISPQQAISFISDSRKHKTCKTTTITKTTLGVIRLAEENRAAMQSVIAGTPDETNFFRAMARVSSTNLTKQSLSSLRTDLRDEALNLLSVVRILSAGTVLFSNETGNVPITIQNSLSVPVTVLVEATGEPSVRVSTEPVNAVTVGPGKRKSIEIRTTLQGTGTAQLRIQLTNLAGAPLGSAAVISLSSASYARVATWVIGLAGALLLIFIVRNVSRRILSVRAGKN
jgi:hypothetical protein